MEKKEYIKPEIEEIALNTAQMIASSYFNPESGDNYDEEDAGSNRRRGKWGNLWYEGE